MKVKLIVGKGFVIPDRIINIDCPNGRGGTGSILISTTEGFWTGETHICGSNMLFHFGDIMEIQTRSDLCETEEQWKRIWKRKGSFTYKQYEKAADLLRRLK